MIAASGMALVMAACETAPVVVEDLPPPGSAATNELLILPLAGLSSTVGGALGERMAWAMREAGYPARSASISTDANPMLTGWIEEVSDGGDIIWLNINWAVYGAGSTLLGNYRQEMAVSRSGWARLSPDTLSVIVAQAVPAIHEIAEVEVFPEGMPDIFASTQEPSSIELIAPAQETIVVSGEGLSHIDASGNETLDQPLSVAAEPTFAPEYDSESDAQKDFPEGSSSSDLVLATPVPPVQIPSEPDQTASDMSADASDDEKVMLTPESAALVTTMPELTIAEAIDPAAESQQDDQQVPAMDESLMELGLEPEEIGLAPGNPQQTVAQSEIMPALPASPSSSAQPALSDGNAAQGFVRPVFLLRNITGAPGDGNISLRRAMLLALREADAMVTDNPAQASYVLQGNVQMQAPFAGRQRTRIIWLVSTISGDEVGTTIQENDVPSGSLDGSWGDVAGAVANSAVPGIAQLFDVGLDAGSAEGNLAQPDLPHVIDNP